MSEKVRGVSSSVLSDMELEINDLARDSYLLWLVVSDFDRLEHSKIPEHVFEALEMHANSILDRSNGLNIDFERLISSTGD